MKVPFIQVNPFILNSFQVLYTHIIAMEPQISLLNYVKSQLHVNIVSQLFGRTIITYNGAYDYLIEEGENVRDFKTVIRWYYKDLANFVLKDIEYLGNDFSILAEANIPMKDLEYSEISLRQVVKDLQIILVEKKPVAKDAMQFNYFEYMNIIPLEVRENLKPSFILAEALVMAYLAKQSDIRILDINS